MAFLNKLPRRATVVDGFPAWSGLYLPFNEFCEVVLRQAPSKPSPAAVTCIFSFMNRFVHGLGIERELLLAEQGGRWLKEAGYAGLTESMRRARAPTAGMT